MFNLFRLCRKDEISFDIVADNVACCFDIVAGVDGAFIVYRDVVGQSSKGGRWSRLGPLCVCKFAAYSGHLVCLLLRGLVMCCDQNGCSYY